MPEPTLDSNGKTLSADQALWYIHSLVASLNGETVADPHATTHELCAQVRALVTELVQLRKERDELQTELGKQALTAMLSSLKPSMVMANILDSSTDELELQKAKTRAAELALEIHQQSAQSVYESAAERYEARIRDLESQLASQSKFTLGSQQWPGVSKVVEEAGELLQVLGKLIGTGGATHYFDGADLKQRLEEEGADIVAALATLFELNTDRLDFDKIESRASRKVDVFKLWHEQRTTPEAKP